MCVCVCTCLCVIHANLLTFLTLPVVHLHVNDPARLVSQDHRVPAVSLGNRSQLCRFFICLPQFASCNHQCRLLKENIARYEFFIRIQLCKQAFQNTTEHSNTLHQLPTSPVPSAHGFLSAFTLIHQGWHAYAVQPLNNWSILWADLRLKCGVPCFLLCPLADNNATHNLEI